MSFSTYYKGDFLASGKKRLGARKITCFELLNFMTGKQMGGLFDIKGKKKDITYPSPFPKKKQPFKIGMNPG
jgi:hypothetical protein